MRHVVNRVTAERDGSTSFESGNSSIKGLFSLRYALQASSVMSELRVMFCLVCMVI